MSSFGYDKVDTGAVERGLYGTESLSVNEMAFAVLLHSLVLFLKGVVEIKSSPFAAAVGWGVEGASFLRTSTRFMKDRMTSITRARSSVSGGNSR